MIWPGTVYIVGAGPGDPGLITVRGLELVRSCDVLVYDNLMADEFVATSRASEKIYVGKAAGRHMMTQDEIGRILVERARAGRSVVRLKGGDPFVFGRGGEECQALVAASIPYVVVPGVTAGVAGPAYAGMPVTHRELSRGVTLVTGHFSRNDVVDLPWDALAGLGHTLVFYMAVSALGEVTRGLLGAGMEAATPAALLEQATTGSQRSVTGTLGTIASLGVEAGVSPPALLVVGRVVALGESLGWLPPHPLAGRTVLFTRAADRGYEAVERLRAMGAKVIDVPVVVTSERRGDPAVARGIEGLAECVAVAFTSSAAVEFFFDALGGAGKDGRALAGRLVVAATRTVAEALAARGILCDVDVGEARSRGLAGAVRERAGQGARVLLPRSSAAGSGLVEEMRAAGLDPVPLVVYDSSPAGLEWLEVKLAGRRPDAVVFLSGSGVEAVIGAVPSIFEVEPRPVLGCVGRVTALALERHGLEPDVMPGVPDVDALVDGVVVKLGSRP